MNSDLRNSHIFTVNLGCQLSNGDDDLNFRFRRGHSQEYPSATKFGHQWACQYEWELLADLLFRQTFPLLRGVQFIKENVDYHNQKEEEKGYSQVLRTMKVNKSLRRVYCSLSRV